jgi:hypothetical protein
MQINTWKVRAGRGSEYLEDFKEQKLVAMGWRDTKNDSPLKKYPVPCW